MTQKARKKSWQYGIVLVLAGWAAQPVMARESIICRGKIVEPPMSMTKVQELCGKPDDRRVMSGENQLPWEYWYYRRSGTSSHALVFRQGVLFRIVRESN